MRGKKQKKNVGSLKRRPKLRGKKKKKNVGCNRCRLTPYLKHIFTFSFYNLASLPNATVTRRRKRKGGNSCSVRGR